MRITLAQAMGTCFGVQDAIDLALSEAFRGRLTIVGQLVHNPQTTARLLANGIRIVDRDQIDRIDTPEVMITAHGASDAAKAALRARGLVVHDATCPLVLRLHKLARMLERKGYCVVIIGQEAHVEVQGVVGNLTRAIVVGSLDDLARLSDESRVGVVAQTTQRLGRVAEIIEAMRALPQIADLRVVDTICKPVKDRQQAIDDLLRADIDLGLVIGGHNSSNTAKLCEIIQAAGIDAHHIEGPEAFDPHWLNGRTHIGITAGTSTPQDVIEAVYDRVRATSELAEADRS